MIAVPSLTTLNSALALDPGGSGSWGSTSTAGGNDRGADPWTYFEENGENGIPSGDPDGAGASRAYYGFDLSGPGYGSSFWSYSDAKDPARKAEGSYNPFAGANGWNIDGSIRTDDLGTYSQTATADSAIGFLVDRADPVWTVPYASAADISTLALAGDALSLIEDESGSTPFRAYANTTVDGLLVTIGDESSETTDGLSRPFFNQYEDATATVTYTGPASGPHDDYDDLSDKCRTCHAVHRAGGARQLTRADSRETVCFYCHEGNHRHASLEVSEETETVSGHGFNTTPPTTWTATGHRYVAY